LITGKPGIPLAAPPRDFCRPLWEGAGRAGELRGLHFRSGNGMWIAGLVCGHDPPLSGNCSLRAWGSSVTQGFRAGEPERLKGAFLQTWEVWSSSEGAKPDGMSKL